ncbi:turripeptide Ici9.2-like [Corythoichthys intestinalis]|uniref:turripeptide Ici9.2-like n=1 Tax=Corythoichthys intestinalis TaxID=161448 RepID=UPI0025A5F793|nr:turripeptide Ici9.2-like [Corythoichthys intestinalis]
MSGRILLLGLLLICVVAGMAASQSCDGRVPESCPSNYDPVCGTDRFTYPNKCSLCSRNPQGEVLHRGECRAPFDPIATNLGPQMV